MARDGEETKKKCQKQSKKTAALMDYNIFSRDEVLEEERETAKTYISSGLNTTRIEWADFTCIGE